MNKTQLTILATVLAVPVIGRTQGIVYATGHSIADQKIHLASWGSGSIAETDETGYDGALSVRVSFRNYFQGGMIDLGTPVDLSQAYGDKFSLLRMVVRVSDSKMTLGGPGGKFGGAINPGRGGGPGGPGGPTGGGGQGKGDGTGSAGVIPGGNGGAGAGATASTVKDLKTIRLVVTTTDGKKSEAYVPINKNHADKSGWVLSAVPLSAIRGFEATNKTIQEVAISGDTTTTIYLGDLRVVTDTTPITGDVPSDSLNLAIGDEVQLHATGYAGSTPLKYSWNFDSAMGNQEDAAGQFVTHKFRKAGTFVVTVTISDMYGLKQPFTKTIKVKVNP